MFFQIGYRFGIQEICYEFALKVRILILFQRSLSEQKTLWVVFSEVVIKRNRKIYETKWSGTSP